MSYPDISSGRGVLKQPCFLFCSVAEMELNGLPWRGWQPSFCNSYLCEMHPPTPLSRASCFVKTGRDGSSMCLNKQVPWHSRNLDNFLREDEVQMRQIGNCIPNEFIIRYPVSLSSDKPHGRYCVPSFEVLSSQRRTCKKLSTGISLLSESSLLRKT